MKRNIWTLLLILCLGALFFAVFAEMDYQYATTDTTNRKVRLYTNGSWDYADIAKKQSEPKKQSMPKKQ